MSLGMLLYIVILIEGYSVLALELLAIRQLVPFVGSGVETIAIIVAAVLMPLAIGYYHGGKHRSVTHLSEKIIPYRKKLLGNLVVATAILIIGFSHLFLELFFSLLATIQITSSIGQTFVYSLLFIVTPVYLLGQTVPLVSNYFSRGKLSEVTGRMLFFSTLGSFLGSIVSTLILMSLIGVHYTVVVTISLLALLIMLLARKISSWYNVWAGFIIITILILNNDITLRKVGIIENNNYSLIQIEDVVGEKDSRILKINRSLSSKFAPEFNKLFPYIKYIDHVFLQPYEQPKKRSILVIGAGGFTLGLADLYNDYTFVDIDKSLKEISEKYFLKRTLEKNKHFIAEPGRLFMRQNTQKYDVIILDAYSNITTIPADLITEEFFADIKKSLAPNGIMVMNAVTEPNFKSKFSRKLHHTMQNIFPYLNRQVIGPYHASTYDGLANVIYSFINYPETNAIYTDDLNTYFMDK